MDLLTLILLSCSIPRNPIQAPEDVCVYFCPNENGMVINKILHLNNEPYSIHGFWYGKLKNPLPHINFNEFIMKNLTFTKIFYDTTSLKNVTGCGQYREYVKHGTKSGYTLDEWLIKINNCQKPLYPHQCGYNGTHNIVNSISTIPLGYIGCKPNKPFKSFCRF